MQYKRYNRVNKSNYKFYITREQFSGITLIKILTPRYARAIYYRTPLTLKQRAYRLRSKFYNTRAIVKEWFKLHFDNRPVYYLLTSTDCDCVEVASYGMSKNYKAHQRWLEDPNEWDWVEGRISVDEVSKEEYDACGGVVSTRDRVMEAYENGNGRSLTV